MARCTITMTVDTEMINPNNVEQCIKFEDSFGQSQQGNPINFTSNIEVGDEVCWVGKPRYKHLCDKVSMVSVTYEADTNILGQTTVHSGPDGNVLATAVNGQAGDEEEYGIYFTVERHGQQPVQYFIDPKLRIQTAE